MKSLGIDAADVYGLVVTLQFGLLQWKAAATADFTTVHPTADFTTVHPIGSLEQLDDVTWLTSRDLLG